MKNTLLVIAILLCSCTAPTLIRKVALKSAEAPSGTEFTLAEGGGYADEFVTIALTAESKCFRVSVENKTAASIKVPWDDVVYVSPSGNVSRVMHDGVKYIDRNNAQPASVIPKGETLSDIIVPTCNVELVAGTWQESPLIQIDGTAKRAVAEKYDYIGSAMKVVLPIIVNGETREYTFEFVLTDLYLENEQTYYPNM